MPDSERPRPSQSWRSFALRVALQVLCVMFAATTGGQLCHVGEVLRRNPFGWRDSAAVLVAAICAVYAWGFFRLLIDVAGGLGLAVQHPGHVAWWLAGGIWVTAAASDVVVEGAVWLIIILGMLLAAPLMPVLLSFCLFKTERQRADWRAWVGFVAGWLLLGQVFAFFGVSQ